MSSKTSKRPHRRVQTSFLEVTDNGEFVPQKTMTDQSFKEESDINNVLRRGGVIPPDPNQLNFLDLSNVDDYHSAVNLVMQVNDIFDDLPSKVRDRFRNDPEEVLKFIEDPNNKAEAAELGLIDKLKIDGTGEDSSASPESPNPGKTADSKDEKASK